MYKNIFIDANVILDTFDPNRPQHISSYKVYEYLLKSEKVSLFTSCDLITTIYYIDAKKDKNKALHNIQAINKTLKVIEFSNKEIQETCDLMLKDKEYCDLEDTIQYIMAKKHSCDLIVSNDESFVSKDIKLLNSQQFCEQNNLV